MTYDDILLDSTGDLQLTEQGDIVLGGSVAQKINVQLKWFSGEWPFDESQGTNWFGVALVKNPDTEDIEQMVEQILQSFKEVKEVISVTVDVDERNRKAAITWKATVGTEHVESEVRLWENSMALLPRDLL